MHTSDLRHAFRSLRRTPWYAITVVGVIALGMALATTVFAVVDGVLFKPLPYPRVSEIFGLSPDVAAAGGTSRALRTVSPAHLQAWREAVPDAVFSGFNTSGVELTLGDDPVELALVDARFLDVLGQRPLIGGFRAEHFGPRGPVQAALITFGLWQRAFGGDPGVLLGVTRALMPMYAIPKMPALDARVIGFCALASSLVVIVHSGRPDRQPLSLRPTLAQTGTMGVRFAPVLV